MNNLPSYARLIIGRAGTATQTLALSVWAQNYCPVRPQDQAATRAYGGGGVTQSQKPAEAPW